MRSGPEGILGISTVGGLGSGMLGMGGAETFGGLGSDGVLGTAAGLSSVSTHAFSDGCISSFGELSSNVMIGMAED